ncbi:hypothetical protein I317_00359 [Kwoniella heveanensis CBS 569]|uniref:General transcription factor 3C polypeptide 3 (Transcription factor C subunit 4) n=1 Tax=Kwoniella heveanensis BCC8398 TaxID=1296120 RepID=A0A1B9GNE8_9TREE|nr:hypothetical protein I316_05770 [Kwoniella heveanensis BCC8398]OCF45871.1 hypothetical protein I317_00359 [Kwoniella heveanensis CBS 569]
MMADIPIDPALLEEEAAAEEAFSQGADDSSEDEDDGSEEHEFEDELDESHAGPSQRNTDDAVFGRLAGFASKGGPSGSQSGLGGRDFQRELVLADDEELPQASRMRVSKPRKIHKPSHEVQRLLGQANMAYIQADHEKAVELFLEVLRQDPYVLSAWTTLASCYSEQGDDEKARQMRFLAAHIDNEWREWLELAHEFKDIGHKEQAVYCFRKALKQDPSDVGSLYELGALYRQLRERTRASDVFKKLLKINRDFGHNFNLVMEYHGVLVDTNQRSYVANVLREAFDWHVDTFTSPSVAVYGGQENTMNLERIVELVDDMLILEDLEQALEVIRKGQRWLQGRRDQREWDRREDDMEYDPPDTQRAQSKKKKKQDEELEGNKGFPLDVQLRHRIALVRLRLGNDEEALIHVNQILTLDVLQYSSLFIELGDALMKREMWEKALECYAAIQECEEIDDTPSQIYAVGICQHQLKNHSQARDALQWVMENDPENINARLRLANVLEDMGHKAEALDLVSEVIRRRAHRDKDSRQLNRLTLAGLDDASAAAAEHLNKAEKAANKRLTKRVLEDQMRTQMQNLWLDVQEAERGIDEGEAGALDRFISAAGTMIENYRLNRGNFSKSRGVVRILKARKGHKRTSDVDYQAQEMQDRLERMLGCKSSCKGSEYTVFRRTEFYGLNYEEWLTLMVKYCCVLMVKNEEDIAMDILEHVVWSGLFHNKRCEVAIRLTIIACAMRLRAYDKIVENCKRLSQLHQFLPLPLLLLLGSISTGGLKAIAAWDIAAMHAYIPRELRNHIDALPSINAKGEVEPPKLHYNVSAGRWASNKTLKAVGVKLEADDEDVAVSGGARSNDADDDEDQDGDGRGEHSKEDGGEETDRPDLPKKGSPYLNVLHAQMLLSSKSYQTALFYLFRAFEIDQYNPFICFLIAQAFFGRATNRQSDNRNYQIAQGLAFLTRYRKLSPQDPASLEEVEYNYGRSFHGLGVPHLAVDHYERVLSSVEKRIEASEDPEAIRSSSLAYEAAHNLMLLYATAGNNKLVREKSKWLAI